MKRYLSLLLLLCIALFMFCACTDDDINTTVINPLDTNNTSAVPTTTETPVTTEPKLDYSNFGFNDLGTKNQWAFIGEFDLSSPESAYARSSDEFAKFLTFNTNADTLYVGWFDNSIYTYDCIFLSNESMQFQGSEHAPKQTLNIINRYNYHNILVLEVDSNGTVVYMIPTVFLNFNNAETYNNDGNTYCRYSFKKEYLNW